MSAALIEVMNLTKRFGRRAAADGVPALCELTLSIADGERWGLFGEPGSGKTTLARMLGGTLQPTSGAILYRGQATDVMTRHQKLDWLRGVQMMFEHADAALNPRLCAGDIISDGPLTHRLVARDTAAGHVSSLMEEVGLDPASAGSYPHEFLPEERHRIALARALSVNPSVLVCDQFTKALLPEDGERLLNLVMERCVARAIACVLISDRTAELESRCERLAVLYRGRLLEIGPTANLRDAPNHPYSQIQFATERSAHPSRVHQSSLESGDVEAGCIYRPSCAYAGSRCRQEDPRLREIAPRHSSACHLNDVASPQAAGGSQR